MGKTSKPGVNCHRNILRVEELEERIAPVVVSGDSSTWIQSDPGPTGGNGDTYWIFYVGPGSADIRGADGTADINGKNLGPITVTGSTIDSALFIMDFPQDLSPAQTDMLWPVSAGTLEAQGNITVSGSIGLIAIDGLFGNVYGGQPTLEVFGNLGKFDVGVLTGDVTVHGDIYEIDADTTIGATYQPNDQFWIEFGTTIAADGNIGAVRAGMGLTDQGQSVTGTAVLGGQISGATTIRANADSLGPAGIIDLIEARSGSISYGGNGGSFGLEVGDGLPTFSAGPGGNIRFMHLDGFVFFNGPGGSTTLTTILVTSTSDATERTIVDDSGGVMVIKPLDQVFTPNPAQPTVKVIYPSMVEYLAVPVDKATQGPGVVIARLIAHGTNTFTVSGNVEVGDFEIGATTQYPEGLTVDFAKIGGGVTQLSDLVVTNAAVMSSLTGLAHDTVTGKGECDIYFLDAMNEFGGHSRFESDRTLEIPVFTNKTVDGDIAFVGSDNDIYCVQVTGLGGDIGVTESVSPYLLKGPFVHDDGDVLWVDVSTDPDTITPFGVEGSVTRYSPIYGVVTNGDIFAMATKGAMGDVRLYGGDVRFLQADSNKITDPGTRHVMPSIIEVDGLDAGGMYHFAGSVSPFGKIQKTIDDGMFGKIFSGTGNEFPDSLAGGASVGGDFTLIRLGEGLEPTTYDFHNIFPPETPYENWPGEFVGSGIYTTGLIDTVLIDGLGHNIESNILGESGLLAVKATHGAAIDGYNSYFGNITVAPASIFANFEGPYSATNLGMILVSGKGGWLDNTTILTSNLGSVKTTGGSWGMHHCNIQVMGGRLERVSADGDGIVDTTIFVNGVGNIIETTGKNSAIAGTQIKVVAGLKSLSTHALDGSSIDILTIAKLSKLDYVESTTFSSGGIGQLAVKQFVANSDFNIAGPLAQLTVGGDMTGVNIDATGAFGQIGKVTVKGDITDSDFFSFGSISSIQSGGQLSADITAIGTTGSLTLKAGGLMDGTWSVNHGVANVQTKGDLNADITAGLIGTINVGKTITGSIESLGGATNITAGGVISGDITTAGDLGMLASKTGAITGNVDVGGALNALKAATNIGAPGSTVHALSASSIFAGGGKTAGNILADVTIDAALGNMGATGDITGLVSVGTDAGNITAAKTITGNIDVGGNLASIRSGGNMGHAGGTLVVDGSLGSLAAGSTKAPARLLSDVTVGANLGTMAVAGAFPASLHVGGSATTINVLGTVGEVGDTLSVGLNVGTLTVGNATTIGTSDVESTISVGVDAKSILVYGNIDGDMTFGNNVGTIGVPNLLTFIYGDVTIHGGFGLIQSGSKIDLVNPGPPAVFDITNFGLVTGALTVDGTVGKIV